jgi:hypothetical protein
MTHDLLTLLWLFHVHSSEWTALNVDLDRLGLARSKVIMTIFALKLKAGMIDDWELGS